MTGTRDHLQQNSSIFSPDTMKLTSSASEQNVYFTYVCLVNDIKPSGTTNPPFGPGNKPSLNVLEVLSAHNEKGNQEGQAIQVERSKALHELVESYRKAENVELAGEQNGTDSSTPYPTTTSGEDSEFSENDESNFICCDNPNVLKLTKMKWLTEDQADSPDSSTPSISPSTSSSNCSKASEDDLKERNDFEDKYLSTILRLDKEHNMFGLSNIAIVGTKASKVKRNDEGRAVFHQTAIVQICCAKGCCKHRSNTDLPSSLKCGGCRRCCAGPYCQKCVGPYRPPCYEDSLCMTPSCTSCPRGNCTCKLLCAPCPTYKCKVDSSFGLKIKLNRKPKYVPEPIELTPRSSSVLHKPLAARSCHHWPHCVPPSSCYPYLMPCFWPARASAPCSTPTRCFHNPPCLAARKHTRVPVPKEYICGRPCIDEAKHKKCENDICPGNNAVFREGLEKRFGATST